MGTPVRKIAQVVDVWVDYLEPWNTGLDAANAREQAQQKDVDSMGSRDSGPRLSPSLSLKKSNGGSGIGFTSSKALDRRIAAESFTELWQVFSHHASAQLLLYDFMQLIICILCCSEKLTDKFSRYLEFFAV